jgi:hypothetical protein
MSKSRIVYLGSAEAQAIADAKLAEAQTLEPGPEQRKLLQEAGSYKVLAQMKGWLQGELRAPK